MMLLEIGWLLAVAGPMRLTFRRDYVYDLHPGYFNLLKISELLNSNSELYLHSSCSEYIWLDGDNMYDCYLYMYYA